MIANIYRKRLGRKSPLRDQIYVYIRDLILTGRIRPGDVVDEKLIAMQLHISRTPVREAVKKLSDENLIDIVAQSSTRAAQIDPHEVEQAYIIRRALESEIVGQAALHVTKSDIDNLTGILSTHARAIERKRYTLAIKTDDNFHRKISEIGNLPRLWQTVEISKAQLDRCRYMMLPRPGEAKATLTQHQAIIYALSTKKPEKARAAMLEHLDGAYNNTLKFLNYNLRRYRDV